MGDASGFWENLIAVLSGTFSVNNITSAVGAGLAVAVVLALAWWGGRKVLRMIMSAFRKGRVSV